MAAPLQRRQLAPFLGFFLLALFERVVRLLADGQEQVRQCLAAQGRIDEERQQQRQAERCDVEDPPQTLPACLSRIIKDLLCHVPAYFKL